MTTCDIIGEKHYSRQMEQADIYLGFIEKTKKFIEERIGNQDPVKQAEIKRAQELMSKAIKGCKYTARSIPEYVKIIESIKNTKLGRVYFEGLATVKEEDPAYHAALKKGLETIHLDEGINIHSLLALEKMIIDGETEKPEYKQLLDMREDTWAKKIKEHGDGLVIVGSDHTKSLVEKLNKSGVSANILYTL